MNRDPLTSAVELRGIAKLYGHTPALRATSLHVARGECMALLGGNGSGKTTLLRLIAGAIAPTFGTAIVFGLDLARDEYALRGRIGFLAADTHLYEDLSARENLRFYITMAGTRPDAERIERVLTQVDLAHVGSARVRTFSSGMRRRLSLARLLLLEPSLLLLDEPYNNLDQDGVDLIDALVQGWRRAGAAVMLATHDADRALAVADSVTVLEGGALLYHGSVQGYRVRHAQHVG